MKRAFLCHPALDTGSSLKIHSYMNVFVNRLKELKVIFALAGICVLAGFVFFEFIQPVRAINLMPTIANVIGGITGIYVSAIGGILVIMIQALLVVANFNNFIHAVPVVEGWKIVRDVCNMFFVLILLVIAIGTILQQGDKYHWTKLMPPFVSAAILINFSKVICGVIIDLCQIIMLTFVGAFAGAAGGNFVVALGIPKLLSASSNLKNVLADGGDTSFIAVAGTYILAALFVTVGLVVITVMVMILIARIVALWFLVVLSPFAFLFSVLPDTSKYSEKWWKEFSNYVIVGPAMAFFLWLSLYVVQKTSVDENNKPITNAKDIGLGASIFSGDHQAKSDAAGSLPSTVSDGNVQAGLGQIGTLDGMLGFLIGIGMMIGSLIAAQEMGVAGSNMAKSAVSGMQGWAVGKNGPSPMRALRERYDAYQNIRKEQRQAKVKMSAAKVADFVGSAKALPGQLMRGAGRHVAATPLGQGVRTGVENIDRFLNTAPANNNGALNLMRRLGGAAVGQVFGGKHWEQRMSEGKDLHLQESKRLKDEAGTARTQAQAMRAAGNIPGAVAEESRADRLQNEAGVHEIQAGIDTARMKVPTVTWRSAQLLAAGATGGVLGGLGGAMVGAASFYGPTALNSLRQDGEEQSVRAKMVEAGLVADEMKKFANMSVDALAAFANGTRTGVTKIQQLGAKQAQIDRGIISAAEVPGVRAQFARQTNSATLENFESSVLAAYPGQAHGMDANRLAGMIQNNQVKWDKMTPRSVEPVNGQSLVANTLQQMGTGVATNTAEQNAAWRAAYQRSLDSISKDNPGVRNQFRDITRGQLNTYPGARTQVNAATGNTEFTNDYDQLIQMNLQMGGTTNEALGIPVDGGVRGTALAPEVENFIQRAATDQQRVGNLLGFGEGVFTNDTRVRELVVNAMQDRRVFGAFAAAGRAGSAPQQRTMRAAIDHIASLVDAAGNPTHQLQPTADRAAGRG